MMAKKYTKILWLAGVLTLMAQAVSAAGLPVPKEYIDLNHPLTDGMVTYPGESLVKHFTPHPRYKNGALVDGLTVLGISATYIDSPHHISEKLGNISAYPLQKLVNLPIQVVKLAPNKRTFDVEDFAGLSVQGKAVLLYSGQDKLFGQPAYAKNSPWLTTAAAKWLVAHRAALVGIDALLVDNVDSPAAIPAHDLLLSSGTVIAEDMTNIGAVVGKKAWLTAVPPRAPTTSFPTRIFATVY